MGKKDLEAEEYEDLTQEEIENIEVTEEELEDLEMEEIEAETEDLEEFEMEEAEALPRAGKSLVRTLIKLIKKLVVKLLSNAATARKLKIACKKGTAYVCKLICPLLCKQVPRWLRPLCTRLCPILCNKLSLWICKKVGA